MPAHPGASSRQAFHPHALGFGLSLDLTSLMAASQMASNTVTAAPVITYTWTSASLLLPAPRQAVAGFISWFTDHVCVELAQTWHATRSNILLSLEQQLAPAAVAEVCTSNSDSHSLTALTTHLLRWQGLPGQKHKAG
jgi:hypothetical protein